MEINLEGIEIEPGIRSADFAIPADDEELVELEEEE